MIPCFNATKLKESLLAAPTLSRFLLISFSLHFTTRMFKCVQGILIYFFTSFTAPSASRAEGHSLASPISNVNLGPAKEQHRR